MWHPECCTHDVTTKNVQVSPRVAVRETLRLAHVRLVRRPPACFAGAMTNLRRPTRSSWRALAKLVVLALLLGVAIAAIVWWVLVMLGNEIWSWVPQFPS